MFKFDQYKLRYFNFRLLLYVLLLSAAGVIFISSATMNSGGDTVTKQIMGIAIGAVCMMVIAMMDYHFILKLWPLVYLGCVALLIAVLIWGDANGIAKRWITLPGIGNLQPSEFSKIGLIVTLAAFFGKFQKRISSLPVVAASVALFGVMAFLIFEEPNLSTMLVITFIFVVMIYAAGISYKWILGVLAACIPVAGILIYIILQPDQTLFQGYQINRIMDWLNPDEASLDSVRQTLYSVQAIASGQLTGKGLFNTSAESIKNGDFLSEEDTDFIFAVIGEETGFVGSVIIVALLFLVVAECIWLAIRARDMEGRLICIGMGSLIAFQTFVNIGVATQLLPNTGLPLPFISAGLSSLLSLMMGMGLVFNVGLQRKRDNS